MAASMFRTRKAIAAASAAAFLFCRGRDICSGTQSDSAAEPPFAARPLALDHKTFVAGEGASWKLMDLDGVLKFFAGDVYIAAPEPKQSRSQWIQAMRQYRGARRQGHLKPGQGRYQEFIALDFDGVRAWVRLANDAARAFALRPGDKLAVTVEARWLHGNSNLCAALDYVRTDNGAWSGWSGVLTTLPVPQDGEWHLVSANAEIPDVDTNHLYVRPILGMDGTHHKTPGNLEIKAIDYRVADPGRMSRIREQIIDQRSLPLDQGTYNHPGRAWMKGGFTCHFTFMYDLGFYNPASGQYQLDSFLADGEREFGGYDILLLWHAYPRIGLDQRNQLDFYRDMPGGLAGLRQLVEDVHRRGVRVFINYNPWDISTTREGQTDEEILAGLVKEIQVDGIFLDTMSGDSPVLRQKLESVRPGIVLAPENNLSIDSLSICSGSWAQWLGDSDNPPGLEHRKWLEPRHMRWQIARNNYSHRDEIRRAFFNGSGMLVWENIFGAWNRWTAADRRVWRRAAAILHQYQDNFASDAWDPFYPTYPVPGDGKDALFNTAGIFVNRWPGSNATVYTLYKKEIDPPAHTWFGRSFWHQTPEVPLFNVPYEPGVEYYDFWNGRPARVKRRGDKVVVHGFLDRLSGLGCIGAVPTVAMDNAFKAFIEKQYREAEQPPVTDDARGAIKSVVNPRPIERTKPVARDPASMGMVRIPGGKTTVHVTHQRRECGCYADPGTPADQWEKFTWGTPHNGQVTHDYTVELPPYLIDLTAVSNAEFKRFLDATGYRPRHAENFLKHWPGGKMPTELADHPVVYVDLEDARAYAKWAGKRLPTEPEWHLAAQGTDGRRWPWGNEFDPQNPDPARVNTSGTTMPVRALDAGRSPYGCYQMCGNVYEWTESEREDGHTRFCIIRGGSHFKAPGSDWYMDGGPRPCDHHAKFIMMWPGLDRCATIGFRCVADVGK